MDKIHSKDRQFHDGDGNQPGTEVPAWWLNGIQNELTGLIETAGLQPDREADNQLLQALEVLIARYSLQRAESMDALRELSVSHGQLVFLLGFHQEHPGIGAGLFYADGQDDRSPDNGGSVILSKNRVRLKRCERHIDVCMFGAVGDGKHDDTAAIQAALDSCASTAWDGSLEASHVNHAGGVVILPPSPNPYRITQTLLIGPYCRFEGATGGGFYYRQPKTQTAILADFADPKAWAISSATRNAQGQLLPYDQFIHGNFNNEYTGSQGVQLKGLTVRVAQGKSLFGGVRLQGAPQCIVQDCLVDGALYGYLFNCCWAGQIDAKSLHGKCGLLLSNDNHGFRYNGYYNRSRSIRPILPEPANLTAFFSDKATQINSAYDGYCFGVIDRYNSGIAANSIICEHNDIGIAIIHSTTDIQSIYAENNKIVSLVTYSSRINLGTLVGSYEQSAFTFGANSHFSLGQYGQQDRKGPLFATDLPDFQCEITLPLECAQYHPLINYPAQRNIVYLKSDGDDQNHGFSAQYPVQSLDAALDRIAHTHEYYRSWSTRNIDRQLNNGHWSLVILQSGNYALNAARSLHNPLTIVCDQENTTLQLDEPLTLNNAQLAARDLTLMLGDKGGLLGAGYENQLLLDHCQIRSNRQPLLRLSETDVSQLTLILNDCQHEGRLLYANPEGAAHLISIINRDSSTAKARSARSAESPFAIPEAWLVKGIGI